MRRIAIVVLLSLVTLPAALASPSAPSLVVVIPVDYPSQIDGAILAARSLRRFGSAMSATPVGVYAPTQLAEALAHRSQELSDLGVSIHTVEVPEAASTYLLGAKPFTTAAAERDFGNAAQIAVVAPNTIFLRAPRAFLLPPTAALGYSTVHHQNIGSTKAEPADAFWSRLYEVLKVPPTAAFSNRTLADEVEVRFYFNAGSFVVRPAHGLLQAWAASFETLIADPEMSGMCTDGPYNIFLHQAALAGAALANLEREQIVELPRSYSYPLFFKRFHGGSREFKDLSGVVTMRYEFSFSELPAGWEQQVSAPPEFLAWLKEHL